MASPVAAAKVTLSSHSDLKSLAGHAAQQYDIHSDVVEVLFTKEQLAAKTRELGRVLGQAYQGKRPLFLPILKGGFIFAADLVRALDPCPQEAAVEFVSARSYGARTETSGTVEVSFDEAAVKGRHCVMVDDLVDSGLTLLTVRDRLLAAGAASVTSCVLLDKRARRKVTFEPDYVGFDCPNHWVAGMGMDTNQQFRSLDYVAVLKPDAIQSALKQ